METRPFSSHTTIFVTTIGDTANFNDCMNHLERQTLGCAVEIIDHVAPMSAAFQEMHERCVTPFYVQVDEDMLLVPGAIQQLEETIRGSPPQVALISAPLWDCDAERSIQGVKIYRHEIVKRFPYQDCLGCDMGQVAELKAAGYEVVRLPQCPRPQCLGEHGKHYTPQTIFVRWQRSFQKHIQLDRMHWVAPYPQRLLDRYLETRDPVHLYALLGAVAGIAGAPAALCEKDWRSPNLELERIQKYFAIPGDAAQLG